MATRVAAPPPAEMFAVASVRGGGDMDRPMRHLPGLSLPLVLALVAAVGLGCGTAAVSDQNGAQPGSTTSTSEAEWTQLERAPVFAGMEAVPQGWAVRVESTSSDGIVRHSLLVPETGSFRLELTTDLGPATSSCDVVVGGVHYLFIPGDGVVESPAAGTGPDLHDAYGSMEIDEDMPEDALWFKHGDSYKATFTFASDYGGVAITTEMTYEVEQDPATGILLWERLSHDNGEEEVRRELVPMTDVEVPNASEIYEYAAESWNQAVEALRQLPYEAVGLDLPGLVLSRIIVIASASGSEFATLGCSLASSPESPPCPTAVQIDLFPYGPDTADLVSYPTDGIVAFRRGDAMIRIDVPANPFGGLDLSLDTVTAAVVPIAQLPDDYFALPASYTPAGATKLG